MAHQIEIKPGAINPQSLELVREERVEAYATTTDNRRVIFLGVTHNNKLPESDLLTREVKLSFPNQTDSTIIIDSNAVVQGGEMWRRGHNMESVKIVTKPILDEQAQHWANMPAFKSNPIAVQETFDWARQIGIWEVVEEQP